MALRLMFIRTVISMMILLSSMAIFFRFWQFNGFEVGADDISGVHEKTKKTERYMVLYLKFNVEFFILI